MEIVWYKSRVNDVDAISKIFNCAYLVPNPSQSQLSAFKSYG